MGNQPKRVLSSILSGTILLGSIYTPALASRSSNIPLDLEINSSEIVIGWIQLKVTLMDYSL